MIPLASIFAALANQRERITWTVLAAVAAYYLVTFGMEIGELKSDNKWATKTIIQLTNTVDNLQNKCGSD